MNEKQLTPIYEDLYFGEGPRWHEGKFWFSDINGKKIVCIDESGTLEKTIPVDFNPSGIDWTPEGKLWAVSMQDKIVYEIDEQGNKQAIAYAAEYCGGLLNDMVIDRHGHAFVSNIGFDYEKGDEPAPTDLLRIDTDGSVTPVASDIWCPNGMAILADETTLIVGQSASSDILAFDIAEDGSLSNRRVYATLPDGAISDGICVDAEGGVWSSGLVFKAFVRILEGGKVTDYLSTGERCAVACMLGGEDGKTFFGITSSTEVLGVAQSTGYSRVETCRVEIAAAGRP